MPTDPTQPHAGEERTGADDDSSGRVGSGNGQRRWRRGRGDDRRRRHRRRGRRAVPVVPAVGRTGGPGRRCARRAVWRLGRPRVACGAPSGGGGRCGAVSVVCGGRIGVREGSCGHDGAEKHRPLHCRPDMRSPHSFSRFGRFVPDERVTATIASRVRRPLLDPARRHGRAGAARLCGNLRHTEEQITKSPEREPGATAKSGRSWQLRVAL
jgi:hypothetical protein